MSEENKCKEVFMNNSHKNYSPQEIIIKLKKLIRAIERADAEMGKGEVTGAQLRVIFPIIRDAKGYSMHELTAMAGVSKGLVSRTIADLEHKGFVERDKATENQDRNYNIVLTKKGQQLVTEKKEKMKQVSAKWFDKITLEDFAAFHRVLNALTE